MGAIDIVSGKVFAGRYRIGRRIGAGGMGIVYEAVHVVTGRPCAVKLMLGHTVQRKELRARFLRESRVAAQVGSEHVVDVLDAGIDPDSEAPFLVMELLSGVDLGHLITQKGRLDPAEVVTYLWHAALALDKTHRASIVHRDLKASNLFLTKREDGSPLVKVLDFGVAKMLQRDATSEAGTQSIGTPIYMAPEQFQSDGRVSPATDIYALGMLAYLLLVGKPYWKEERDRCENPFAFANLIANAPKEPASARAERCDVYLPPAFDPWFERAAARRAEDRFSSATQAISALAAVFETSVPRSVPPPPPSVLPPIKPPPARGLYSVSDVGFEHKAPSWAGTVPDRANLPSFSETLSGPQSSPSIQEVVGADLEGTGGPISVTNARAHRPIRLRRAIIVAPALICLLAGALIFRSLSSSDKPNALTKVAQHIRSTSHSPIITVASALPLQEAEPTPTASAAPLLPPRPHTKHSAKVPRRIADKKPSEPKRGRADAPSPAPTSSPSSGWLHRDFPEIPGRARPTELYKRD